MLKGIARHDDGWAARDATPQITRQGKPSAFSVELVGKYSAFEEIDLADYLAVRDRAVRLIAAEDPYAALLISMHTYSLLNDHADRSTIAPDAFAPARPVSRAAEGISAVAARADRGRCQRSRRSKRATPRSSTISGCCRRTDNLSLLTCVDFSRPANLLHPLPLRDGGHAAIEAHSPARGTSFSIPYPFAEPSLRFQFPARHVKGKLFSSAEELGEQFAAAAVETQTVTLQSAVTHSARDESCLLDRYLKNRGSGNEGGKGSPSLVADTETRTEPERHLNLPRAADRVHNLTQTRGAEIKPIGCARVCRSLTPRSESCCVPYGGWATGVSLKVRFWSMLSIGMSKLGWLVRLNTSKLYLNVNRSVICVIFTMEMSARFCQDWRKILRCPPPGMKLVSNVSPAGIAPFRVAGS